MSNLSLVRISTKQVTRLIKRLYKSEKAVRVDSALMNRKLQFTKCMTWSKMMVYLHKMKTILSICSINKMRWLWKLIRIVRTRITSSRSWGHQKWLRLSNLNAQRQTEMVARSVATNQAWCKGRRMSLVASILTRSETRSWRWPTLSAQRRLSGSASTDALVALSRRRSSIQRLTLWCSRAFAQAMRTTQGLNTACAIWKKASSAWTLE